MGQINSNNNSVPKDMKYAKIYNDTLRSIMDDGDRTAIKKWEKEIERKIKDNKERWYVLGYAIRTFESWGRYRIVMELAVNQIETAQDIKTKSSQTDFKGSESLVSINTTLAESYLNLAR